MQNHNINASMTNADWIMLVTLSIVWGGSFFFVGVIVQDLPPQTIVFVRVLIAAMTLHIFLRMTGRHMPWTGAAWSAFFVLGLLNNVIPFSLIVWSQTQIASGVASIFNATTPLFTVLVAHTMTNDEKLTPRRITGVLIGMLGVAIMIGVGVLADGITEGLAQIALLGATLSYAFAIVYGRRFKRMDISPYCVATGQVTVSTILLLPIMLVIDQPWTLAIPSAPSIAALIGLGTASTAFAYILYFKILSSAGATNASLVTFLVPVSAIFLGIVFLGEVIALRHVVGLALIVVGLLLVDGRLFRRPSKAA